MRVGEYYQDHLNAMGEATSNAHDVIVRRICLLTKQKIGMGVLVIVSFCVKFERCHRFLGIVGKDRNG
jgi:hypothetical protein